MATAEHGSKSAEVRKLLAAGTPPADIAKKVGCTLGLVYNVKSRMSAGKQRRPGQPRRRRGEAPSVDGLAGLVESIRQTQQQHQAMHTALERIGKIVAEVL